jgi:hypothetical protein
MRARQRHFNPAHAGASVVLDARYGFSQSDNSDVDNWDDRSNNNNDATQSMANYKPKYRTSITGGQPAIEFLPVANQQKHLNGSFTNSSNTLTYVSLVNLGASPPSFARACGLSKNNANDFNSAARGIPLLRNSTNNQFYCFKNSGSGTINISLDTWYIVSTIWDGTNGTIRLNESSSATQTGANATANFDLSQYRIGFAFDSNALPGSVDIIGAWKGYISSSCLFNTAVNASMRKRLQFSTAFSFKIACN